MIRQNTLNDDFRGRCLCSKEFGAMLTPGGAYLQDSNAAITVCSGLSKSRSPNRRKLLESTKNWRVNLEQLHVLPIPLISSLVYSTYVCLPCLTTLFLPLSRRSVPMYRAPRAGGFARFLGNLRSMYIVALVVKNKVTTVRN